MKNIKNISVRMDEELHSKLRNIAEYEGRTLSGQVLYLIRKCVREYECENGPILEDVTK